ncbi:hypothetical protein [Cellulomonas sp. S1-8]|uniref:DUF7144 family membrane protein n=1 Tax=Cellulomonas sp. S1-8 TaxID=2904790 RepID=UPI002243244D|nr:hypothetical protein [Cellulomonas sp. S1-8]UZN03676.1 hypothetical protein OKX07_01660 [Cellulomonas sp. S1-8]
MSEQTRTRDQQVEAPASDAAVGGTAFAAVLMIMIGAFHAIQGSVALFQDDFYVVTPRYVAQFDLTTWGWIHLVLGLLVLCAGFALLADKTWARVVGVILAATSALANFAFIPYYPFWALTIIALDVFIIWALTARGRRSAPLDY